MKIRTAAQSVTLWKEFQTMIGTVSFNEHGRMAITFGSALKPTANFYLDERLDLREGATVLVKLYQKG